VRAKGAQIKDRPRCYFFDEKKPLEMSTPKKIFLAAGVVFFALLFYASYDIATRTTFPGSKPQLKERIKKQFLQPDTLVYPKPDSAAAVQR
jgi:hypothetical protein